MSTKECPSCGSAIEDGQLYCPACGTKIEYAKPAEKRQVNAAFNLELLTANDNAASALNYPFKKLTTISHYQALDKCEQAYLTLIQKYPTEPKAYTSYVDFIIKYVVKITSLPFSVNWYFDFPKIVSRCRAFLDTAKSYADDGELEQILQLDSALTSQIEAIANDDSISKKQGKNKKIQKWCFIGTAIFFGLLLVVYLIAEAFNL